MMLLIASVLLLLLGAVCLIMAYRTGGDWVAVSFCSICFIMGPISIYAAGMKSITDQIKPTIEECELVLTREQSCVMIAIPEQLEAEL